MKILVTGGAGFIGSHLADALVACGHKVAIIDNLVTGLRQNVNPRATFYEADIRGSSIAEIFERERFEVVFHQAAQMDVRHSVADPRYDAEVNILGTLNLLQLCQKMAVKSFIFASTGGAVYGEQNTFPADEEHQCWPASPYGVTKMTCERYIYFFGMAYGLKYVLLRYANVYGPRQNPHGEAGVVAIFCQRMLRRDQAIINGDGKQTRDYVYVDDVVAANVLALDCPHNDYFNIGTGVETDVNAVFACLNEALAAGCKEVHGPPKPGEQRRSVLACTKAKKLLGWQPKVDINEGLQMTARWFRDNMATH